MVATDREQPAEHAGRQAEPPRAALERAREQPQREHQVTEADDLARMLQARIGRAAEREGERRDQRAGRMPAAIAKEQDDADAAEEQVSERHAVERDPARRRVEQRQQEIKRREDQRLRVGDLRPAREHVGRPERRLSGRQRARQEIDLRSELRLPVPRDRDRARQPGPCRQQERERENAERQQQRLRLGRGKISGRRDRAPGQYAYTRLGACRHHAPHSGPS